MLVKLIITFLLSGVKYMAGMIIAFPLFNPVVGFLVTTGGAIAGIFTFTYGEIWLNEHVIKRYFYKNARKFTRRSRFLIKLKHTGGLPLVALLTPVLLTIPVGCILATTFIHERKKIFFYISLATVLWGLVVFGSLWVFGVNLAEKLDVIK